MSKKVFAINFLISVLSATLTFVMFEIGSRIYDGNFKFESFRAAHVNLFKSAYPALFDPILGHVPKPGYFGQNNPWKTTVTIDQNGIRSNGHPALSLQNGAAPILAVGDSFTFGDQVSDWETWPAALEVLTKTRVINGGVFGYGIDQSYIRALQLADKYKPSILILSFIADDIHRAELSERTGVAKPYFVLASDDVELRNSHIRERNWSEPIKDLIGHSHLIHRLMAKFAPAFWFSGTWEGSVRVHKDGIKVACALVRKLSQYAKERAIRLYLLPQYLEALDPTETNLVRHVLACHDNGPANVIDLLAPLQAVKAYNDAEFRGLFDAHMTAAGNLFVANLVFEKIEYDQRSISSSTRPQ